MSEIEFLEQLWREQEEEAMIDNMTDEEFETYRKERYGR